MDWEERYQTGDMPWEKGEASPGLVDFLAAHPELPRGTVCVPGCGTGHDVRVWASAGFEVLGLDVAPSAIRLCNEKTPRNIKARYALTDFLAETPLKRFDWLFEHTLFCAIDPGRRDDYVQAVLRWLKPDGQFLAVHYLIPDKDGPPFGTTGRKCWRDSIHIFDCWTIGYPGPTRIARDWSECFGGPRPEWRGPISVPLQDPGRPCRANGR